MLASLKIEMEVNIHIYDATQLYMASLFTEAFSLWLTTSCCDRAFKEFGELPSLSRRNNSFVPFEFHKKMEGWVVEIH